MKRSIRRILPPTILLVAGLCALVYGTAVRTLPVWRDVKVPKETTILEAPPKELWSSDGMGRDGRRIMLPKPPPRVRRVTVEVVESQSVDEPERRVVREVTVGRIVRKEDGRLELMYSLDKAGPALCPT